MSIVCTAHGASSGIIQN